jgi:hypothetical protein
MTHLRKHVTVLGFGGLVAMCASLAYAQGSLPVRSLPAGGTTVARTPPPPPPSPPKAAPAPPGAIATAAAIPPGPPCQPTPMHAMSGHSGPTYTSLAPADKTGIVNAARAKFGLMPLSQAEAVALAGGALVTPGAPVSGKSLLTLFWGTLGDTGTGGGMVTTTRTSYVFQPVPMDASDAWHLGFISAEFESQPGGLYAAECAFSSPQPLTISVVVKHGRAGATGPSPLIEPNRFFAWDNAATASVDATTHHAQFAFRAKGAVAQLAIETYQTKYVPNKLALNGDDNYFAFTGCSLVPAGQ